MKICLDANCVIYLVEDHPIWAPKVIARIGAAKSLGASLAVCDLARTECLIGPLRSADSAVMADYRRFFSSPSVTMLPLTESVCERAAMIRVASQLAIKLPDALHLAAAIEHGCNLFLTNDGQLSRCSDIVVEVLS